MNIDSLKPFKKKEVIIKNLVKFEQNGCRCGSWLDHWLKFSYVKVQKCVVIGCSNIDLIGCGVTKIRKKDESIYIIPMCKKHSQSEDEMKILPSCPLISADIKITCGEEQPEKTKYVEI